MNNSNRTIRNQIKIQDLEPRHQEIANVIGLDSFLELCEGFGGGNFSSLAPKSLLNLIARRKVLESHSQDKTLTGKQLAEMYGISVSSAYNYMKKVGK